MDNLDGAIGFKVGLDNSQLASDSAKTKALLRGIGDTGTAQGSRIGSAFNAASGMVGMMAMGAVGSIGLLGKTILDTTAKFEKFGIVLKNTLGETKGADALNMIANFAATTPFQLDEVTGAFIKMANQGFVPTRNEMIKLGDLASSTGKSFDQLAEAILDANTGQFERLKEFGIKASQNGDRVTFSFKEQKTTVENTNSAIQAYLLSLGELKGIAGANEKISASLTGQMSNLGDKMAAMYNQIGTSNKGFLYAAVGGASTLIENYETVGETIKVLIGIYGVYKVAVMAVAYAENIKAATVARNLAIETQYAAIMATKGATTMAMMGKTAASIVMDEAKAAAILQVNAAEMKLAATSKASMLANPYVLAAMAVAALGYAIFKLINHQTDLEIATQKANGEISNEKDKAAQLFAELNNTTKGTDEWKKAKQGILDQYGTYLSEQQKELIGTKNQAEAQKAVNDGIRENIQLKIKEESLGAISNKYNPTLNKYVSGTKEQIKEKFGAEEAANFELQMQPLIYNVKFAVDDNERNKAYAELDAFVKKTKEPLFKGQWIQNDMIGAIKGELIRYNADADAIKNAFNVQAKANETTKTDPVFTTYTAQLKTLQDKKKIAEKELAALKVMNPEAEKATKEAEINTLTKQLAKTSDKASQEAINARLESAKIELGRIISIGIDPKKAITAKQGEIDEINKQLGVKEQAAKKEQADIRATIEGSKEYLAIQDQILAKYKELEAANDSKHTKEGMQITQEINALEKKRDTLTHGGEKIDPLGATVATKSLDLQLKPMKQLTEEARKQLEIKAKQASDDAIAADGAKERQKQQADGFYDIADAASFLSSQIGDGNSELAAMLGGVAKIAGQMGNLIEKGAFSKEGMSKGDAYSSIISGATQMVGMFMNQAAKNKQVMEDYYASVIKQQNDYNLSLNEQLRLNTEINGSVFFDDFQAKITDASAALRDATEKRNKAMAQFYGSEAIVGKKNVVSGENVLGGIGAGAAMGAGIGALVGGGVLSVPAAAVGAVIGALVGGIAGVFAKKKKDIVAPLLETYPLLIDANGKFNIELAKTLVENEKVTKETKAILENVIEWEQAAKAAREQIIKIIADMTGSLGDDLRNALVDAFEEGTSAAVKFGEAVSKVLEDLLSQQIFNSVFGPALKQLQSDMELSSGAALDKNGNPIVGAGVDGDWMDDIRRFLIKIPTLTETFNTALQGTKDMSNKVTTSAREMTENEKTQMAAIQKAKKAAEMKINALKKRVEAGKIVEEEEFNIAYATIEREKQKADALNKKLLVTTPGLNLFNNDDTRTGSSKGFTAMTQDSADELNGRFTVIQGHTFSINAGVQILATNSAGILKHLAGIKADTGRLEAIELSIGAMKMGIDTMNLKGITIKK